MMDTSWILDGSLVLATLEILVAGVLMVSSGSVRLSRSFPCASLSSLLTVAQACCGSRTWLETACPRRRQRAAESCGAWAPAELVQRLRHTHLKTLLARVPMKLESSRRVYINCDLEQVNYLHLTARRHGTQLCICQAKNSALYPLKI